jgi:hypothetical protein
MENFDQVRAILKAHMAEEAQAGFPNLSRTPSSSVIKFLDYATALAPTDLDSLLDAMAHGSAFGFFSPLLVRDSIMELTNTDPALLRYRAAMQSQEYSMGMRHQGLRMMKAMLNDPFSVKMIAETRAKLNFVPRDDLPPALVPDPDIAHLKPAKAPLTKKLFDRALKDLFATSKERVHGETVYTGSIDGVNLKVSVDFNAMGLQLRYGVTIPDETKTIWFWHRTYEDLWGAGPGWDYLTEENAEASVQLLCDQIAKLVRLRNTVMNLRASGS